MKEYILLTGASSGISYEMATQLTVRKSNLLLVTRSETKLQQMQKGTNCQSRNFGLINRE
jgi:short-subunit dehydrogenase